MQSLQHKQTFFMQRSVKISVINSIISSQKEIQLSLLAVLKFLNKFINLLTEVASGKTIYF